MATSLASTAMSASSPRPWVQGMARFGYAAKGVVYLMVGYLAARAALFAGDPEGSSGALRELLREGGRWMVLVIAAGLAAHVVWRVVQAAIDPDYPDRRLGRGVAHGFGAVVYASLAFTALRMARGEASGAEDGEGQRMLAAELLSQPFGEVLVALVGAGVLVFAGQQLWTAARRDVTYHMEFGSRATERAVEVLGRVGIGARAVVFAILGVFFIDAARWQDPGAAGGTEDALRSVEHPWLLAVVAAGLATYGLFQVANAIFRRVPEVSPPDNPRA